MPDDSMPVPETEKEMLSPETDIPVRIDSLEADGVRPQKGDEVTVRITGTVDSIRDDCVYVRPTQINDTDINEILAEHSGEDNPDELDMMKLAQNADSAGMPMGGGY